MIIQSMIFATITYYDQYSIDMIFNCGDLAFSNGSEESRAKQRDNEYNESIQIMKSIQTRFLLTLMCSN